jgi:hypothetical protein
LILGAQKAGTSTLTHYLQQQPGYLPGSKKEVHYFDSGAGLLGEVDTYQSGESWYKAHFPLKSSATGKVVFEATPMYLFHPLAARRIQATIPDAKLIILLRDPIQRAISHYHHVVRHGFEQLDIHDAMLAEEEQLKIILSSQDYNNPVFRLYSYKSRGVYFTQILEYLKYFPREQLLILDSSELFTDPVSTLEQVNEFLGIIEPVELADKEAQNVGSYTKDIPLETIDYLSDYFQSPNQQLFEFLGKDLNWSST